MPHKYLKDTSAVWGLKVLNSLHLGLWWGHLTVTHHIPKVLHTGLDILTLGQINNQAGISSRQTSAYTLSR